MVSASLLTTFFPHLNERGVNEFRWALGAGVLVLGALYVAGLITAALVVSALLVPVLYVLYLYEARVYRDAPVPVMLATIGGGFLIGIISTLVLDGLAGNRTDVGRAGADINYGTLLIATAVVPLIKEIVKPIPALVLRGRPEFGQSIDGLVFGIAAGLGYAAAETIIHFSAVITSLPVQSDPTSWIAPLATVGILLPLLHGSSTGLITAAIWRRGRGLSQLAIPALLTAVVGQVAFAFGARLVEIAGLNPIVQVIWEAIVVVAVLIAVRLLLDRLLRDEATAMGLVELTCANCGSEATAAGFCTSCGVAVAATSRTAPSRSTPRPQRAGGDAR
ncbi:MAG: PrsW family glutamic-type intramembrane protease [Candidatus Limnocylindrales bacterium]